MENPYTALADKYRISLDTESVDSRPDRLMNVRHMDHWKCVLRVLYKAPRSFRTYSFYYSKGYAHQGARPTIAEVLESFRSDLLLDISSFENFCSDLGMNPDSISDLKVYNTVKKQNDRLRCVLGAEAVSELLDIED